MHGNVEVIVSCQSRNPVHTIGLCCCDLYTFPGIPATLTEVAMKEDAIICWECYDWKLDIDWDKLHSRPMA